jgi:membrane protein
MKKLTWSEIYLLIKTTFIEFFAEKSSFHGAAIAYYTIVALVPILFIGIELFGSFVGQETMVKIISGLLSEKIGIKDISGITVFLNQIDFTNGNIILRLIGVTALIISSTALLSALKHSLNEFFDIDIQYKGRKKIIKATLRAKLTSLILLAFFGVLIIVTYFAQTILLSLGSHLFNNSNGFQWFLSMVVQYGLAIGTSTLMFAGVFKFLHDAEVKWKLAWAGGFVTAVLLYLGQMLIKYYLVHMFFAKNGGVAGTMLIILAWMFYTSQIIFFGAKFTAVYARMIGIPITPKK